MYSGVMATPDLVWAGSLDGTFAAYDAKTLEVKWSMNVGTSFQGSPIAFTAGGKEYIAIVGGGIGIAAFGHPELENKSGRQHAVGLRPLRPVTSGRAGKPARPLHLCRSCAARPAAAFRGRPATFRKSRD